MEPDKPKDTEIVLFQGSRQLAPGEFEQHSLKDLTLGLFGRNIEEVKADWKRVSTQIREMIQATEDVKPTGYGLDSVTISLGFNAKGQLVFIAEAGVKATVSVTFKRV
jgi:hypothetical protein